MRKTELLMLVGLLVILGVTCFIFKFEKKIVYKHYCDDLNSFRNEAFMGQVLKKYIDTENHSVKTVSLANKENNFLLARDTSSFFTFLQVGDLVLKELNTDTIKVYRNNQTFTFKIYLGCNIDESQ